MLMASVVVLPKPGKDGKLCASYRPIYLLNIDLKIFTGVLATRLSPLLHGLIEPDQAGFVATRQYSDNTRRLLHLLDKVHRQTVERVVLSVDAEKAFDRVHWPFLETTLERFWVGSRFRRWVLSGYSQPSATVRVNRSTSEPFPIARGM